MDPIYLNAFEHIQSQYAGIFSAEDMQRHFDTYVRGEKSKDQFKVVQSLTGIKSGDRLLDLGCGFGSFVLAARQEGVEAYGIDIAPFDIKFAIKRAKMELGQTESKDIYLERDALNTNLPEDHFDVVTAWNVLEHVNDYTKLVKEAYRVLKPGGHFIGVAPNYFSFRKEAHYQVWWLPLLPKSIGRVYLRLIGKDPFFLDNSIFYITNIGALRNLKKVGFRLLDPQWERFLHPELILSKSKQKFILMIFRLNLARLAKLISFISARNPLKSSISFWAQKPK